MNISTLAALLVVSTALFAYVNTRFIGLPTTLGVMATSLTFSVLVVGLHLAGIHSVEPAIAAVKAVRFDETVFQGMLGFLLFAGALQSNLSDLHRHRWSILSLATISVVVSTAVVAVGSYWILRTLGVAIPFSYSVVFGALISPTDPVAVLAVLKQTSLNNDIRANIAGESLFNDGVGVVAFTLALGGATSSHIEGAGHLVMFAAREIIGGVTLGLLVGYVANVLMKSIDNAKVEILITLGAVMGGYVMANWLQTSAPIAMVCAGLIVGHYGRAFSMSEATRTQMDNFWELCDEILNAMLFVLIGLELLALDFQTRLLVAAVSLAPLLLASRYVSILAAQSILPRALRLGRHAATVLTWAGLRGAISVAMALSLPDGPARDVIVTITYGVVVLSVLVQGTTVGRLVNSLGMR